LGNGIKFTKQGSVKVVLRHTQSGDKSMLSIDVIDSGIGISEQKLSVIFDPFVQADSSVHRNFGGTGLGLAISLKFAQALGGDISVSSELGTGTTFTVSLDTGSLAGVDFVGSEVLAAVELESDNSEQKHWVFPPANILVVDDGTENRELLRLVLEDVGLGVELAENGQVGVEKTVQNSFDIILMDIQMPVMDGFTAVGLMRQNGIDVPIIALTANAMKGVEKECLVAGYSGYQSKPLNLELLIRTLAELLDAESVECDNNIDATNLVQASGEPLGEDWPLVSRLADNPRFHPIIRIFAERLEVKLAEMDTAYVEKNYNELGGLAHWLKGAGGTVGFDMFTEPAKELELFIKSEDDTQVAISLEKFHYMSDLIVVPDLDNNSVPRGEEISVETGDESARAEPESIRDSNLQEVSGQCEAVVSRFADDPRFGHIIVSFVDRLQEQLVVMDQAWKDKNYDELAGLAHWLKGAGGTVGYDEFTKPAARLENFAKDRVDKGIGEVITELHTLTGSVIIPCETNKLETTAKAF